MKRLISNIYNLLNELTYYPFRINNESVWKGECYGTKTYAFNLITLKFTPIIYLSNIIYSKDKKTCIIYVNENNQSGATLEIKQNAKGEWNSYTFTGDWLND